MLSTLQFLIFFEDECKLPFVHVGSSVWKNLFASHQASQLLISARYSAFHLWTLHPPPSSRHCWSVWRVFKRLQGRVKLDRARCNEKHARESDDIKWHTNTPRQTQYFSRSVCPPPQTDRQTHTHFCIHCAVFAALLRDTRVDFEFSSSADETAGGSYKLGRVNLAKKGSRGHFLTWININSQLAMFFLCAKRCVGSNIGQIKK